MEAWLDIAPCGYLCFKDDGTIVYINQTLAGWLEYSKDELVGNKFELILTVASRIFYNTHFFPLLKLHFKAEEIFLSLRASNKTDIPVLTNAERRLEDGFHLNHCVFIPIFQRQKYEEDILAARKAAETALTENKYLEQLRNNLEARTLELEMQYQTQHALHNNLSQFSKIVSHDLREPVRKLLLFTDMLSNDSPTKPEKTQRSIERIRAAAVRLSKITGSLHQYLTIEAESPNLNVDLNQVIEAASLRAKENRQLESLDIFYNPLPVIHGYGTQLELLFFHLIDNAILYKDSSRSLLININWVLTEENLFKLDKEKYLFAEHIRINVTDNGIGFDNEYKEYVTGLFNKLNPSTEGLGIGLSIIKKVVENHSGSLSIESQPGVGTTLSVLLPTRIFS